MINIRSYVLVNQDIALRNQNVIPIYLKIENPITINLRKNPRITRIIPFRMYAYKDEFMKKRHIEFRPDMVSAIKMHQKIHVDNHR